MLVLSGTIALLWLTGAGKRHWFHTTTGDHRVTFLGITLDDERAAPWVATRLQRLAENWPQVKGRWVAPVYGEERNGPHWCREALAGCAAWMDENPQIAAQLWLDVVAWFEGQSESVPLPVTFVALLIEVTPSGQRWVVSREEGTKQLVSEWFREHGYPVYFDEEKQEWAVYEWARE
jgi:hypothetical protein